MYGYGGVDIERVILKKKARRKYTKYCRSFMSEQEDYTQLLLYTFLIFLYFYSEHMLVFCIGG